MQQSLARHAAEEFARGNYLTALDLYRKLSELLGERNVRANIALCERRLRKQGRRDCSRLPLKSIKVACVMDEFTFHCYEPECNLFPLTPDNVVSELEAFGPDLLFIESAWRGKDELWNRKIGILSSELKAALQWCKMHHVPTIFWNKEDPIHFETFLTTAQQFDYVFTTDIDCIARYKLALGHERIYLLPFACQPKIHNPIELYPRKDAFCFAGAYYVRYPERTRDLEDYVAELPKFKPFEIFDRNFGKDDINYQFPPEYHPYIVGTLPFNEIDKAYKGYRYAINLNSIKQSQTMFARRVFELLGSNTITVSNFSRGVRLLFGDLVIASDNGKEIVERLKRMDGEEEQKFRLAGLRKVMLEHTYGQRLACVANKTLGWGLDNGLPRMLAIALVGSEEGYLRVCESYQSQRYSRKRLLVVLKDGLGTENLVAQDANEMRVVVADEAARLYLGNALGHDDWVTLLDADDYYGPNYLLDLALASYYSEAEVIGKATRYQWCDNDVVLLVPGQAYHPSCHLSAQASAIKSDAMPREQTLLNWLYRVRNENSSLLGLAIDPFNYCHHGRHATDLNEIRSRVDDLTLNAGLSINELVQTAENISAAEFDETTLPRWNVTKLVQVFGNIAHQQIHIEAKRDGLRMRSHLPDEKHEYLYAREVLPLSGLPLSNRLETHLDATPGLDVQCVFVFLDHKKEKLGHVIHTANRNHTATIPPATSFVRIGWRIYGSGEATIKFLLWGHRKLEPARLLGRSDTLLLTNHYPSYDNLYRNGFVHSRVKAYRDRGVYVDVFRLRPKEATSYHEFQNVDVMTAGKKALHKMLGSGRYKNILVHFLSPEMWEVLEHYPDIQRIVWVHGAEIQPWHRRDYNYQNEQERGKAKRESDQRTAFWRGILEPVSSNLKLVFVSRYFAEEVFGDLGFRLPEDSYTIIHNPIDTELFSYEPKSAEQRKRVLSIRPYASRKYANDLSVKAILKLAEEPCFQDMELRMIGDGILFDETIEPLRKFSNVIIERRFLTHAEITALHKLYGVYLTPTRMDAQGVSRDEAMSSGLVPITNAVAAIPEFVDDSCGVLAEAEDVDGLAAGIMELYENPARFEALSRSAAERVRWQSGTQIVVWKELALFKWGEIQ